MRTSDHIRFAVLLLCLGWLLAPSMAQEQKAEDSKPTRLYVPLDGFVKVQAKSKKPLESAKTAKADIIRIQNEAGTDDGGARAGI
jgi:hypothetical protein